MGLLCVSGAVVVHHRKTPRVVMDQSEENSLQVPHPLANVMSTWLGTAGVHYTPYWAKSLYYIWLVPQEQFGPYGYHMYHANFVDGGNNLDHVDVILLHHLINKYPFAYIIYACVWFFLKVWLKFLPLVS